MPYKDPEREKERQARRRKTSEWQEYHRNYSRRWRAANPERSRAASKKYHDANPAVAVTRENRRRVGGPHHGRLVARRKDYYDRASGAITWYKALHPCMDCGEANPIVLEFDHVRGEKKFAIGNKGRSLGSSQVSLQFLLDEVEKCDVVCANCHRLRTHARRIHSPIKRLLGETNG